MMSGLAVYFDVAQVLHKRMMDKTGLNLTADVTRDSDEFYREYIGKHPAWQTRKDRHVLAGRRYFSKDLIPNRYFLRAGIH